MEISNNLANHLLIAMPTLKNDFFSQSVIYVCEHLPDKGAMGIVINKSLQITLEKLLQHIDIEVTDQSIAGLPVLAGGLLAQEQGFVIHDRLDLLDKNKKVTISTSKDLLREISQGKGPDHFIVALGYAAWEKGQLEEEINQNDWLLASVDQSILFSTPIEQRWKIAGNSIGIDLNRLSGHIGHA